MNMRLYDIYIHVHMYTYICIYIYIYIYIYVCIYICNTIVLKGNVHRCKSCSTPAFQQLTSLENYTGENIASSFTICIFRQNNKR